MSKKGWLILGGVTGLVLLGCVGCIGGGFFAIFSLTKPPVEATDKLLVLLGEGKSQEAYASTAAGLASLQSEADFTAAVKKMGLTQYASSSWMHRNILNNEATLKGTVYLKNGGGAPLKVKLVNEAGVWRVPASGSASRRDH